MVFVVSFLFSGCADASIAERRQDTSSTLYTGYVGTSFPTSFMPWLSRDGIAPTVASMIYNTLFSYDTDSGTYAPLTAKAGAMWIWKATAYTGSDISDCE